MRIVILLALSFRVMSNTQSNLYQEMPRIKILLDYNITSVERLKIKSICIIFSQLNCINSLDYKKNFTGTYFELQNKHLKNVILYKQNFCLRLQR